MATRASDGTGVFPILAFIGLAAVVFVGLVVILLRKGADVIRRDSCGETAIARAAAGGHGGVVSLLAAAGAKR
jgi:hypothetical protein